MASFINGKKVDTFFFFENNPIICCRENNDATNLDNHFNGLQISILLY